MLEILEHAKTMAILRLASSQIAGPALEDALRVCRYVLETGRFATLSPWRLPGQTALDLGMEYSKALTAVLDRQMHLNLSIKPGDLDYDAGHISELASMAKGKVGIHFDAQDPDGAGPSIALLESLRSEYNGLGCTLPARWNRSFVDAERAIALRLTVRVVKGQWLDRAESASDCRKSFLELVEVLAGRAKKVLVATHDAPLARAAMSILKQSGTEYEAEQMLGLPPIVDHSDAGDAPIRIYVPYGHPYLPYRISDVRQRPAIAAWVLKDLFLKKRWSINTF